MKALLTISSLFVRYSGTSSCNGCGAITTPAACTEALRHIPSILRATSSTSATRWSFFAASPRPGSIFIAWSSVMFSTPGIILVSRSTSA